MAQPLNIEVYFDLICPWCLIGKRNLDLAVASWRKSSPKAPIRLQWRSIQLIPEVSGDGLDFASFYLQRLGSPQAVRARQAQVLEAASAAGASVDFSRIRRFPNTLKAHQLLAFAAQTLTAARTDQLLEKLFAAYFNKGQDIGDMAVLRGIATEFALDPPALAYWMEAGLGQPEQAQVPGVPLFVFNRVRMLSGALAPGVLLNAMRQTSLEQHEAVA